MTPVITGTQVHKAHEVDDSSRPITQLPASVTLPVRRYLHAADRLLPGSVVGCWVVGSAALGAYRDGQSDIDLVLALGPPRRGEIAGLRLLHLSQAPRLVVRAARRRSWAGTINSSFVRTSDLQLPVGRIRPVANHVGHVFTEGEAFDVNPVQWATLARHGIAALGPSPAELGLDAEPGTLRAWNVENLKTYWSSVCGHVATRARPLSPWRLAWVVLGPARLHRTITTGEIVSKEAAGPHALEVVGAEGGPIVRDALAARAGRRRGPWEVAPADRNAAAAHVMERLISSALASVEG